MPKEQLRGNSSSPLRTSRRLTLMWVLSALAFLGAGFGEIRTSPDAVAAQALQHRADSHAVISRARLDPPLRPLMVEVRFSPDGRYILLQDEAGIYVLTHEPLVEKFWIPAGQVLPATFSSDSHFVVMATPTM